MTDTLPLTNRRLLEVYGALKLLASRALEPITAQRVAILYNTLRPFVEAYELAVKPLQEREAAAMKLDEDDAQRAAERSAVMAEFDALTQAVIEVPKPRVRLTQPDLPKRDKKANDPSTNTAGNAMVQATLAPEFFDLSDPDAATTSEDEE